MTVSPMPVAVARSVLREGVRHEAGGMAEREVALDGARQFQIDPWLTFD
jgi:hypothetical protein